MSTDIQAVTQPKVVQGKKEYRGNQLADALQGTYEERMKEEKTILVKMVPGDRPSVSFTGFWNGRFIRAAMDSVAKAYRLRKYAPTRPRVAERSKSDV